MGTPGKITAVSAWPKRLWASPSHLWNEAYSFLRISSSVLPWSQGSGLTKTGVGVFTDYQPSNLSTLRQARLPALGPHSQGGA